MDVISGRYGSPTMTLREATTRHLDLEGCFNVRDVGGYRADGGAVVRWSRLYRAGGPHAATAADVEALQSLGIATVIDLRTREEVRERAGYTPLLTLKTSHTLPMTDVSPTEEDLSRWTDPRFVADAYYTMVARVPGVLAEVLALLADPGAYPALIHCSAGKDRTGVVVAIVLGILGVEDQTIAYDYA